MKKHIYTFVAVFTIILLSSCSFSSMVASSARDGNVKGIKGDGKIVSRELSLDDYTSISATGIGDIVYEQNPDAAPYLRYEIDENLVEYLDYKVEKGVLKLRNEKSISTKLHKIYTNSRSLASIDLTGVSNITLKGNVSGDKLTLDVSGVGSVTSDNLLFNSIKVDDSGVGGAVLKGTVDKLNVSLSGVGNVNTYDLIAKDVKCDVSGVGSASVYASESLSASLGGVGNINYKGSPSKIDKSSGGIGKIRAK